MVGILKVLICMGRRLYKHFVLSSTKLFFYIRTRKFGLRLHVLIFTYTSQPQNVLILFFFHHLFPSHIDFTGVVV